MAGYQGLQQDECIIQDVEPYPGLAAARSRSPRQAQVQMQPVAPVQYQQHYQPEPVLYTALYSPTSTVARGQERQNKPPGCEGTLIFGVFLILLFVGLGVGIAVAAP
jgi:hypothetical protein